VSAVEERIDVLAEISALVREAVGLDPLRELDPAAPLSTFGLDSLALVNAVSAVEEAYAVELPDDVWEDRRGVTLEVLSEAVEGLEAVRVPAPAVPAGPGEQPGVSRLEGVYAKLEARGAAGTLAARVLDGSVAAVRRVLSRHEVVVMLHDLAAPAIPLGPPAGVTIDVLAPGEADASAFATAWPAAQASRFRRRLQRRLDAGATCLAARENGRIVAYILLSAEGDEETRTSPGTCFALDLYEGREVRGRGIGLALLAASVETCRALGFERQAGVVLGRNRPMIAASTQLLGFAVAGRAQRRELLGLRRWRWELSGTRGSGRLLRVA
jgi:acyl carrier protein/GNAT superfamily N-acetyltransferase